MIDVPRLHLSVHAADRARERLGLSASEAIATLRAGRALPEDLLRVWAAKAGREGAAIGVVASRVADGWALWVIRTRDGDHWRPRAVTVERAGRGWCRLLDRVLA